MTFSLFYLLLSLLSPLPIFITNATVLAPSCPDSQKSALLTLFSNRTSLPSWKSDGSDCCHWEGVACDPSNGQVTVLNISGRYISASVNSAAFASLSSLRVLDLSIPFDLFFLPNPPQLTLVYSDLRVLLQNLSLLEELHLDGVGIRSQVPEFLSNFTGLKSIRLSYCGLLGTFPRTIFQLPKLRAVDVSGNSLLKSSFPELSRESDLQELVLTETGFFGHLPDSFGYMRKLTKLLLGSCRFSGFIPPSVNSITGIVQLDISSNGFSGTILPLENLAQLVHLDLSHNNFVGPISALQKLTKISYLDLSTNNFTGPISPLGKLTKLSCLFLWGNHFTGPISPLGKLTEISYLDLSSNNFTGPISPLAKLTELSYLSLTFNNFTGPISPVMKLTKLSYLDLSYNAFIGQIPFLHSLKNISQVFLSNNYLMGMITLDRLGLQNLQMLDASNNLLFGKIPSALFTLPSLESLDLSQNRFNDTLDEFACASQSLEAVDLSNNNLQGQIPTSVFRLTGLVELDLSSNSFSGTVQIAVLQNLRNLLSLDLSDNLLSIDDVPANSFSPIPSIERLALRSCNLIEVPNFLRTHWSFVELDLSNNKIRGEIPAWIWTIGAPSRSGGCLNLSFNLLTNFGQIQNLSSSPWNFLDLHSNKLQGSILLPPPSNDVLDYSDNCFTSLPTDFTSYLNFTRFLSLSSNNISGEIPESICSATNLEVLNMSNNKLRGSIPKCLGEISNVLNVLDLRNNSLSGTIPEIFKKGCNLRTLDLNGNQFHGKVPTSLRYCRELEVLDLGNNQLNDIIPPYLDSLPELRVLVLRANEFHGTITRFDDSSCPMLQIVDLSSNNLSGNLPKVWFKTLGAMTFEEDNQIVEYESKFMPGLYYEDTVMVISKGQKMKLVKIMTIFTSIDLSNNNFEGMIPPVLGALNSLHVLNMSNNGFTGSIPASIGNMTQLESLDLSQNKLSGEIPSELTRLTFLEVLNLSDNQLRGPIPQTRQFLTFTNESYIGNTGLCGSPLSKMCDSQPVPKDAPATHEGESSGSKRNINGFVISILVGYFVGLGSLVMPLLFWRKWSRWYFRQMDNLLEKLCNNQ